MEPPLDAAPVNPDAVGAHNLTDYQTERNAFARRLLVGEALDQGQFKGHPVFFVELGQAGFHHLPEADAVQAQLQQMDADLFWTTRAALPETVAAQSEAAK